MPLQFRPYLVVLVFAAALVVSLGALVWRRRSGPARGPFAVGMIALAIWSLATVGQLANAAPADKLLWYKIGYLGVVVVPAAWFLFLFAYTGRTEWLSPRRIALLGIEPIITLHLVWSEHEVFVRGVDTTTVTYLSEAEVLRLGPVVTLEMTEGPWFWINVGYSYLLLLVASLALVAFIRRRGKLYRRQATSLLIGTLVPWLTNAAVLSGTVTTTLGLTPFAFAVTGVIFAWALLRQDLFGLIPLAHETVVDELDQGVLVVDPDGRISGANPAAERILEGTDPVGRPVTAVVPEPETIEALIEEGEGREEVSITTADAHRHLDVRVSTIGEPRGEPGRLVVLQDVTDRVVRRQRLEVLGRILRHNVRNDMNLVLGHATSLREGEGTTEEHAEVIERTASDLIAVSEKARDVERMLRETNGSNEAVDLVEEIEELVDAFRSEHPDVEFVTDLPARTRVEGMIVLAVRELLENAIKHGDECSRVLISVDRVEGAVEIAVDDDGPGIPDQEKEVLTQGHETALEHGSGLGLWLVNWIAHSAGGDLRFESSEFDGSRVVLRVPRIEE